MNLQPRHRRFLGNACFLLAAFCFCSCSFPALHGGRATTTHHPTGVITQSLVQGENPSQSTTQTQEQIKLRSYVFPAGTRIEATVAPESSTLNPQPSTFVLPAPVPVIEREESRTRTELGAAQKDTARELTARLSSFKGIVWVGVALFTFGLASLFWPPLKIIIASTTTSIAITLGGIALVILPSLVAGHELLIFGGVALVVGAWFLAHRHGRIRGQLAASVSGQKS